MQFTPVASQIDCAFSMILCFSLLEWAERRISGLSGKENR